MSKKSEKGYLQMITKFFLINMIILQCYLIKKQLTLITTNSCKHK